MRISLCNEVIDDRPFTEQCVLAASLGYDGLEIAPFTLCQDPRDLTDRDIAEVSQALSDAGIAATGLHWLLVSPKGLSITSPDAAVRSDTLEVMTANIELCAALGGDVLVHGSPLQRMLGDGAEAIDGRARAVDIFAAAAEAAERHGVIYCLEALSVDETNFINRIDEAMAIVDEIGSPAFKAMLDTGAAARSEDRTVADSLRHWMPTGHIRHIQFNDRNRRAAGQGDDDFVPVLRALKETGYEGTVAMEPFIYEPDRASCAAYTLGYVKGIWEALA